ncbi:MAG: hypothetical protein COW00_10450 [Bdellovibrio sp. CG12_big_fil_rev_8_21_14_0_65_39_13]|nr:MAG: hypothetical protein COW78_00865 [Bdellovibrio sp. CG22_combo_CG10-13_8_21_14_all_39_27]PIQ59530.1 MAG: hypothetical protein COW00_10450 [Bdellovibrio sp. CG12_big_fil_rev_8_21_14_0_65_39_13]PIR33465.1 MAG: hypothetical protein COV37_16035 [Bdellovibrio sp. CG11_big_fil_rev_8_21_14_0_20_39_38]PJB52262.1 MAG: hypothetical protein CO099_13585 [Bdellovibrio sp. CG_4_9_14_3_um_filter_39_7]
MKFAFQIVLLLCFLSGHAYGQERVFGRQMPSMNPGDYVDNKDAKAALTDAYKWYRENKDKDPIGNNAYKNYLYEQDQIEARNDVACADCPRFTKLTKQVNDVLKVMARDPKMSETDLVEEIGSLDAMYAITMDVSRYNGPHNCFRSELNFYDFESKNFSFEDQKAVLIMTKNIDASQITAIQMRMPGSKKIYYYRGKPPHQDKIVKVSIDGNNKAKVDYFVMRELAADKKRDEKLIKSFDPKKLAEEEAKAKALINDCTKKRKLKGYIDSYDSRYDENCKLIGDEKSYFKTNYGVGLETNGFLPRKLVVLEAEGKTPIVEGINATVKTEVSSSKREVELGLKDDKNEAYVTMKANDQGKAEVGVPYKFNVYATDLNINGQVIVGNQGDQKTSFVLKEGTEAIANFDIGQDQNREFASVGKSTKIGDGNLSIKFETARDKHTDAISKGAWFRYSIQW